MKLRTYCDYKIAAALSLLPLIVLLLVTIEFVATFSLPITITMTSSPDVQHKRVLTLVASSTDSQDVTGSEQHASIDKNMLPIYDALAKRLITRYQEEVITGSLKNNQLFVGIAGGPGSGKSTLANAVAQRINSHMNGGRSDMADAAVVLPMDGFHFSRAELQSMGNSDQTTFTYDDLIARRGAPWTFDAERCITEFIHARNDGRASLPIYSRVKSDPVPDGVTLTKGTKFVLLEGNYLLSWDDERWAPLRTNKVFNETWYITCQSLDDQRERLVKRHLETWSEEKTRMWGAGEAGARAKADANDMLNLEWIEKMSKRHADLIITSL